jgi:phosphoglycerol transferase
VGAILYYLYNLKFNELSLPIKDIYAPGDGRLTIAVFKMIVAEEWSSLIVPFTSYLNAPFNFEIYDFPLPFFSDFLYIKLLSIFSSDSVVVFNLYYISTYFLNAFTMYWVLRRLRVNVYLAVSIGIIFTFLPFHFWRLPHTFYSGYFFIPLWIYYLLLLTNKKPLFFKKKINESKYKFDWSKRNIIIILVLLISSTWNFYYTFFFTFLIGFTLISNFIYKNSKYHIFSTLIFLSLAVAPFMANMAPYKAYEIENGKNFQVGQRDPMEAEILGLKIATLVFPTNNHRSDIMANFKQEYSTGPLYNESNAAVLGVVGAIGFLLLILIALLQKYFSQVLVRLSQLNLVAVLLSTVGGFGVVFAYVITPQIRAYNRISVFIAATSFMAIALILNHYITKSKNKSFLALVFSLCIVIYGTWDMTGTILNFKADKQLDLEYLSDKNFIQRIESKFDTSEQKILIAQYPYLNFPENPGIHKMGNYEQFQGYIHSDKLYWSFGAIRGREADSWWKNLTKKPIEEQIQILKEAGFSGLMINRNGYKDNAKNLESKVTNLLEKQPITSENKVLSFFELTPTGNKVLLPPLFNSFYQWEGSPGKFRWAGESANIVLYNNTDKIKTKDISFSLGTLRDRGMTIKLNGQILEKFEMKSGVNSGRAYKLQLKPGRNRLEFETKESATVPSGVDNRKLLFSFGEFAYDRDK